jgi:hypothetical protein
LAGLVNKEDIELKEIFIDGKTPNGINGHLVSNNNGFVKPGGDEGKESS